MAPGPLAHCASHPLPHAWGSGRRAVLLVGRARGLCVVRGAGDVGSAVAHSLFSADYDVVIHERPAPAHSRRGMAFIDAVFDGACTLEGVPARRADLADWPTSTATRRDAVLITVDPYAEVLRALRPDILVDARMLKREQPERQIGHAPVTIGLGPNFVAGMNADIVIETAWGNDLGKVITRGAARPLAGEPKDLGGHTRGRFVYAPAAGLFRTDRVIGERVSAGDVVASLDGAPLQAPLSGYLRGITRSGVHVDAGSKVIEVDPRAGAFDAFGLGERPRRIALGVLWAVAAKRRTPTEIRQDLQD